MGSFKCTYCGTGRITKVQMDEHVTAAHGGPKSVGDRQETPEKGDPSELLRGMTAQMQHSHEEAVEEQLGDSEEDNKLVREKMLEDRPRMNVKDQHMTWGGKALPAKVRVYDKDDHERHVPPDIALDRVAFKGWTWPSPGEARGHRKGDKWWTSRPCRVCAKVINSDGEIGPDEGIIQHERKKHRTWWGAHQADTQEKTQRDIAEAIKILAEKA